MIRSKLNDLTGRLMTPQSNEKHTALFCKALYVFLLFKIFYLWPLIGDVLDYKPFGYNSHLSYLLFAPLVLTKINAELFLFSFALLLVISVVIRVNYITAFVVCWFSISLSRLFLPIINGSDLVLNLFLIVAIALPLNPKLNFKNSDQIQRVISNVALLFVQIQFALIYLLSGYDKLLSSSWRSGAAIDSINNLTFFHNPFITLHLNEITCLILSWSVILFEIGFGFLIWAQKFRIPLLTIGIFFHLGIAFVLGLVDFALVMMICYGVYLPFKKTNYTVLEV
ncbi:MAG: HTTM domain-containing protein [Cyclobacteriaceae bacterium]